MRRDATAWMGGRRGLMAAIALLAALLVRSPCAAAPPAPQRVAVEAPVFGAGGELTLSWVEPGGGAPTGIASFVITRSLTPKEINAARLEARRGAYEREYRKLVDEGVAPEQARTQATQHAWKEVPSTPDDRGADLPRVEVREVPALGGGTVHIESISGLDPAVEYDLSVASRGSDGALSPAVSTGRALPGPGFFLGRRIFLLGWILLISGSVMFFILRARQGEAMRIRRIAALEAVDEAVGRATEMGRPVLFIPGIQDMDNVQTIAGITVLARVARTVAEYDATIEVPTARSLAMQASREAVQASYMQAGRSDSFNADAISYITDEQFGFVAYTAGRMVREKPAACFYMGCFFAESLILAETGNSIGAIQIAGTAESSQLPFFVAACDYTLIGEEFFAASAYLSGEPDQLGSIKGQDLGKAFAMALILAVALFHVANAILPGAGFDALVQLLRGTIAS